jgi:hypothetical protein
MLSIKLSFHPFENRPSCFLSFDLNKNNSGSRRIDRKIGTTATFRKTLIKSEKESCFRIVICMKTKIALPII